MAAILPNPFALKSNNNHRYLNYKLCSNISKKGVLKFCEEGCDPKFRTENARIPGYVNIIHVDTGKYLRRERDSEGQLLMVMATADTPDEDTKKEGCTLFQPLDVGPDTDTEVTCRIIHVQSGLYLRPHNTKGEQAVLCAVNLCPDPNGVDVFTAVGR